MKCMKDVKAMKVVVSSRQGPGVTGGRRPPVASATVLGVRDRKI
jgi:hypothetical protein